MWSWSDVVTPWDVKQYAYCPAIPWIARAFNAREPETYSMKLGRGEREGRRAELASLGFERPIRLDVEMYSPSLRMAGICDAVCGSRWYTVVEVKAFKRKKLGHFRAQLMAYALLCETCLGPARRAALVIAGRPLFWDVGTRVLEETRKLAQRVREVVESERPPLVQASSKCSSCWYKRFCPAI